MNRTMRLRIITKTGEFKDFDIELPIYVSTPNLHDKFAIMIAYEKKPSFPKTDATTFMKQKSAFANSEQPLSKRTLYPFLYALSSFGTQRKQQNQSRLQCGEAQCRKFEILSKRGDFGEHDLNLASFGKQSKLLGLG